MQVISEGWNHPAWTGIFYPQDMPDAWRLTYYANEFRGVLVPQRIWLEVEPAQITDWLEDVGQAFKFYLELEAGLDQRVCSAKSDCFQTNLGGWVLLQTESAESRFEAFLASRNGNDLQFFLASDVADFPSKTSVRDFEAVTRAYYLQSSELSDLRMQRKLLERIALQCGAGSNVLLVVKGKPPSVDAMRQLQDLTQLLGFA